MPMSDGWIKLHRGLLESAVWRSGNSDLRSLWVWCLLKASYRDRQTVIGNDVAILKPGQFVTGRHRGAKELGIAESTFRNKMEVLEKLDQIGQESNSLCTVVTIKNWATYQLDDQPAGQQQDSRWTAAGQPLDTITRSKEGKKERVVFTAPGKDDVWAVAREYRDEKYPSLKDSLLKDWCANFYDYQLEREWRLKTGKVMSDWVAALRRWIRTDYQRMKGNQ